MASTTAATPQKVDPSKNGASNAPSSSSSSPAAATQKWQPRWKQQGQNLPTFPVYPYKAIATKFPSKEIKDHTFVLSPPTYGIVGSGQKRKPLALKKRGETGSDPADRSQPSSARGAGDVESVSSSSSGGRSLADLQVAPRDGPESEHHFSRVMIHLDANPSAPEEIWTRNYLDDLPKNFDRPLPVFKEIPTKSTPSLPTSRFTAIPSMSPNYPKQFEFLGHWCIKEVDVFEGGSEEVMEFIKKRDESKKEKREEVWKRAINSSWGRVRLEKSKGEHTNPMEESMS